MTVGNTDTSLNLTRCAQNYFKSYLNVYQWNATSKNRISGFMNIMHTLRYCLFSRMGQWPTFSRLSCLKSSVHVRILDFDPVFLSFFFLRDCNISTYHGCVVWIEKSVTRVTDRHHEACRVIPNSDPEWRIFYPHHTPMIDTFSCIAFDLAQSIFKVELA